MVVLTIFFLIILLSEVEPEQLECPFPAISAPCDHKPCASEGNAGCWTGYPQSRFPNWTHHQVVKSRIYAALTEYTKDVHCTLHRLDVDGDSGLFTDPGPLVAEAGNERETWDQLINEKVSMIEA